MLTENQKREQEESERIKARLMEKGELTERAGELRPMHRETDEAGKVRMVEGLPKIAVPLKPVEPYVQIAKKGGKAGAMGRPEDGRVVRSTNSFS